MPNGGPSHPCRPKPENPSNLLAYIRTGTGRLLADILWVVHVNVSSLHKNDFFPGPNQTYAISQFSFLET